MISEAVHFEISQRKHVLVENLVKCKVAYYRCNDVWIPTFDVQLKHEHRLGNRKASDHEDQSENSNIFDGFIYKVEVEGSLLEES